MTAFENIIRPFQSRDVTPPTRIVGKEVAQVPIDLTWGGDGSGKVMAIGLFNTIGLQTKNTTSYIETKRDVVKKKITNPDDPSQFVEVEQIKKLYTNNKAKPTEKQVYEFKEKKD